MCDAHCHGAGRGPDTGHGPGTPNRLPHQQTRCSAPHSRHPAFTLNLPWAWCLLGTRNVEIITALKELRSGRGDRQETKLENRDAQGALGDLLSVLERWGSCSAGAQTQQGPGAVLAIPSEARRASGPAKSAELGVRSQHSRRLLSLG